MLDHLEGEENDTLILYVDAFDVLLQRPLEDVLQLYCEYQWQAEIDSAWSEGETQLAKSNSRLLWKGAARAPERLVFSAEENCYPFPNYWRDSDLKETEVSGIAYSKKQSSARNFDLGNGRVLKGDELCYEQDHGARMGLRDIGEACDQASLQQVFLRNPHLVMLDHEARIFVNLHTPERGAAATRPSFDRDCSILPIRVGKSRPAVLHFNGNGKGMYSKCAKQLLGEVDHGQNCPGVDDLDKLWNWSKAFR